MEKKIDLSISDSTTGTDEHVIPITTEHEMAFVSDEDSSRPNTKEDTKPETITSTTEIHNTNEDIEQLGERVKEVKPPVDGIAILTEKNEPQESVQNEKRVHTCMPPPSSLKLQPPVANFKEVAKQPSSQGITSQKIKSNKATPPLPYKTPTWSGQISEKYRFEILKGGVIVGNVDLQDKCSVVFGRLECCDVVMEHPSISRYHAVVQYRSDGDDLHPKGLYVYDLDSTHGTFLNKEQIRARTYYRIQVGHMLKLGGSSRVFLLQGPPDDQENESDLTITQLKELRRREESERIAAEAKSKMEEKKIENEGVDWGFGEDAEEDPLAENPFALSTSNEDLYVDDPKKSLRGWFEREGYDLEYQVEEKGFGHFSCKVLLPVDTGQSLYAEASVKGKKKEAVALCALEACRILDRYGLFRQSHHESRKRKHKNWEEDDFYDSDEDTYLDRTGTIEKKREMRKKLLNKEEIETYDSLIKKLGGIEEEIAEIQNKLQKATGKMMKDGKKSCDQDSLEAFMSSIQSGDEIDKKTKSNMRLRLSVLQQEKTRIQKLANLAQPTSLPPLIKDVVAGGKKMIMIGSMKGGKKKTRLILNSVKAKPPTPIQKQVLHDRNSEMDAEEEGKGESAGEEEINTDKFEYAPTVPKADEESFEPKLDPKPEESKEMEESKISGVVEQGMATDTRDTTSESDAEKGRRVGPKSDPEDAPAVKKRGRKKSGYKFKDIYDGTNPDYAMWLPPEGQTGDGRTFLNEKFGY